MGYFDDTDVEKLVSMLNDGIGKDSISVNQMLHNGDYVDFVSGPGIFRKNAVINVSINKKNIRDAQRLMESRSRRVAIKYVLAASVFPLAINTVVSLSESTTPYEFLLNFIRPERTIGLVGAGAISYLFYKKIHRIASGSSVGMDPYTFERVYGRRELRNLAEYFRGSSRKST